MVLSKASTKMLAVSAKNWSESAHRFLKQCADSGNVEASYTLGMVSTYIQSNPIHKYVYVYANTNIYSTVVYIFTNYFYE